MIISLGASRVMWGTYYNCINYLSVTKISATVKELNRMKRKFGAMPNDGDLQGAASALNRLHSIYRFDIGEFIQGNIMGHLTPAKLDAKDTFYLGRLVPLLCNMCHFSSDP